MKKNEVKIQSSLSQDELLKSIQDHMGKISLGSMSSYFSKFEILGETKGNKIILRKRPRMNNSFAKLFYGEIIARDDCSEIIGKFQMATWIRIFIPIWFGGTGLFLIGSLFSSELDFESIRGTLLMLIFGFLLVVAGRWFGKGDESIILEWLEKRCLGV